MDSDAGSPPEQALDEVWRALRDHYPMLEYAGCTGDEWVEELRPRVRACATVQDAFPVIEGLVLRLRDYHTRLRWPGQPVLTRPPVGLGWVEGGLAVRTADPGSGVLPGDRILKVDGRPADEALQAAWRLSNGATMEAHRAGACDRLVAGPPGTTLRLATPHREVAWVRPAAAPNLPQDPERIVQYTAAPDGEAGVLRVTAWGGGLAADAFVARLDAALEQARAVPHLVIDVRGNGGGDDALADACTGRFISRTVVSSISFLRHPGTHSFERSVEYCAPRGPWRYEGRVAVLTNAGCCSACEHFVSGMDASGAACLVGEATTGACGWSRRIPLTCGATLFCAMTFPLHGGVPSPLHGIEPHYRVPPTLVDLRAGRDGPMAVALAWLRSGLGVPEGRNRPWTDGLAG